MMTPSSSPETNVLLSIGLNAMLLMDFDWVVRDLGEEFHVFPSHERNWILPSKLAEAKVEPSELKARDVTIFS
jgi:hypothetical protein